MSKSKKGLLYFRRDRALTRLEIALSKASDENQIARMEQEIKTLKVKLHKD